MSRLDYTRLGRVASRIVSALANGSYRRLTKQAVREIIVDAIRAGRLDPSNLQKNIRGAVEL